MCAKTGLRTANWDLSCAEKCSRLLGPWILNVKMLVVNTRDSCLAVPYLMSNKYSSLGHNTWDFNYERLWAINYDFGLTCLLWLPQKRVETCITMSNITNPFFLVILWSRMAFKRARFIETTTFLKSKISFSIIILPQFARADQFEWIVLEAQEQTSKGKKRF